MSPSLPALGELEVSLVWSETCNQITESCVEAAGRSVRAREGRVGLSCVGRGREGRLLPQGLLGGLQPRAYPWKRGKSSQAFTIELDARGWTEKKL